MGKKIKLSYVYIVVRLDSPLQKGQNYNITFEAKYHQFAKYRLDSFQVLLVSQQKDIDLWLAEKSFLGMYVPFSLKTINNGIWEKISGDFISDGMYIYDCRQP